MPRGAKGGKCGPARGATQAVVAAPSMPQAAPTRRERAERDARPLRERAFQAQRSRARYALAWCALPRTVEEWRAAPPRSWHICLTLECPCLLELAGLRERRGPFQQRRTVGLVGQVADTPEILRQEGRLFGNSPAE